MLVYPQQPMAAPGGAWVPAHLVQPAVGAAPPTAPPEAPPAAPPVAPPPVLLAPEATDPHMKDLLSWGGEGSASAGWSSEHAAQYTRPFNAPQRQPAAAAVPAATAAPPAMCVLAAPMPSAEPPATAVAPPAPAEEAAAAPVEPEPAPTAAAPRALERPIFHAYGRANTRPASGGIVFGDYMTTHNARAGDGLPYARRLPASARGFAQVHSMESSLRRQRARMSAPEGRVSNPDTRLGKSFYDSLPAYDPDAYAARDAPRAPPNRLPLNSRAFRFDERPPAVAPPPPAPTPPPPPPPAPPPPGASTVLPPDPAIIAAIPAQPSIVRPQTAPAERPAHPVSVNPRDMRGAPYACLQAVPACAAAQAPPAPAADRPARDQSAPGGSRARAFCGRAGKRNVRRAL